MISRLAGGIQSWGRALFVIVMLGGVGLTAEPAWSGLTEEQARELEADIDLDDPELMEMEEKELVISDDPFSQLAGWWGGTGRLSFKDGKSESVRCRATYFVKNKGKNLNQNVRCASSSGKIEVKSKVAHAAGKISGTWQETAFNMSGDLDGQVTPRGFRVSVDGGNLGLSANMEIVVREREQIIEIQFFSETLLGLTLVLKKG